MRKMNAPATHVLAWESSSNDAVQAVSIILERAKGVQLGSVWPTDDEAAADRQFN